MRRLSIERLRGGMKLSVPIRDENDNILLNRNVELTDRYIRRLKDIGFQSVYISDPDLMDVVVEDIISDIKRNNAVRHLKNSFKEIDSKIREIKKASASQIVAELQSTKFKKAFARSNIHSATSDVVGEIIDDVVTTASLNGLNSLKTFDNYTYNHSIDVTITAIMIGKRLKFNARQLHDLAVGCLLHDVGKLFIPLEILNKPGKLTPDEFDMMKEHTTIGYEILRNFLPILAIHVAYQHHERQDGTGYPRGIAGTNRIQRSEHERTIAQFGEVTAIADVYDAMSSDRPYRKAMMHDTVIDILQENAYTHFNAEILNNFLSVVPRYPIGSNCEIVKGEYPGYKGVVVNLDQEQLDIPMIRLIFDPSDKRIKPIDLNLRKQLDTKIKLIDV